MPTDCITYQSSGFFTPIITDYLNQKSELHPFFNRYPGVENFAAQIQEKQQQYPKAYREILVERLNAQYQLVEASEKTKNNIAALGQSNTFTVTTGHQLNLFTGPLYFLYKIASAVNLAAKLQSEHPEHHFVPVYWMATEDHDFEEINYFNVNGRKFRWNRQTSGAVGRLDTKGLDDVFEVFSKELGAGKNADALRSLFDKAYLGHATLAQATRFLANELFGSTGLVIIDGDDSELKRLFSPYIKAELLEQKAFAHVSETIQKLANLGYDIQVNPREINLFYLGDGLRERIIFEKDQYRVNNTSIGFSKEEILLELDRHPENFSPNVVMRPLYQEVILPNLCYIGGGGELAYWLELKSMFDAAGVAFPVLLLRNSVLVATQKQADKADRLGLSWQDLFAKPSELAEIKTRELSSFPIDLSAHKLALQHQFDALFALAEQTDRSFSGAVKAQYAKQTNGLENLEKRLLKAQKRKHAEELARIAELQNALFPNGGLQERQVNFAEFYASYGRVFIEQLLETLDPMSNRFDVLVL